MSDLVGKMPLQQKVAELEQRIAVLETQLKGVKAVEYICEMQNKSSMAKRWSDLMALAQGIHRTARFRQ